MSRQRRVEGGLVERARPAPTPRKSVDVTGLEPDAVRVVELIVKRMRAGRALYGDLHLETNPKNWPMEALEEFVDGAVYMAIAALKKARVR